MKKIIVLSFIVIWLTSCWNNQLENKKQINVKNNIEQKQEVKLTPDEEKIIEQVLEIK